MSEDLAILKTRAARLAARVDDDRAAEALDPVLVVRLGPERFGLPMDTIDRVLPLGMVSAVPLAPPTLYGIMAVRGEIHSVYHLDRVLGLPITDAAAPLAHGQVVIFKNAARAGVRVDAVEAIDHVKHRAVEGEGRAFVKPEASEALVLLENVSSLIAKLAGEEQ